MPHPSEPVSADHLGVFLETHPDATIVVGSDGTVVHANALAEHLFGYPRSEMIGLAVEALLPERLRAYHAAHRRAYSRSPNPRPMGTGMDLLGRSRDGREIPVEISLSPVETDAGSMTLAAVRDITTRRDVERALREAKVQAEEASEAKSRFLAAAGHDLRQPLQSLGMYLGALEQVERPEGSAADLVRRMRRSVTNLAEVLDALLDVARLDTAAVVPEVADFAVDELISGLASDAAQMASAKGLALRVVPSRERVRSDRGLLGRIVGNFLGNAVRHTAAGRMLLGCRRRGANLRIEVWDTGPGIPEDRLEAVFEEFVQLDNAGRDREKGLGLGLAIARRVARLLGHELGVRSVPGRGSVFWVDVPRVAPARPATGDPAASAPAPSRNRPRRPRILFIEDDVDVAEATSLVLALEGYEVVYAGTSDEAMARVADGVRPDVVLSDFRLPGGENGVQVVLRIRTELGHSVPVVFMTGDTSAIRIRETRLEHCAVLRKPVDRRTLAESLDRAIGPR